ncbi:MAG: PLP-dependent transferase [Dehalococcoidia bacterium]|nr:MAG: PLP-dependent transferase [Dehalococcoidia bacterium]
MAKKSRSGKEPELETLAIHAGGRPEGTYGAVSTPIYQTSTFAFEAIGKTRGGYDYSRTANPTRKVLEETIARLEGGKAGFACATGLAAATTVMHLLRAGDHVISGDDIYGGTFRLFQNIISRSGIEFTFLRLDDRAKLEAAIRPNTRMLWLETPSNPLLNIIDLEMVTGVAKKHRLLTVIDNTFSSPYFLKPVEFGIDLVVHSTTKYLNGHCDVVGGAIVTTTDELTERMQFLVNGLGTCASPFDCWLVLRGIETLAVRMQRHQENAGAVADYLANHPKVKRVYYPGLPSHPGHEIARRQMKGFGGIVTFELGDTGSATRFLENLEIFTLAESLGGVSSLAAHPATMTHASMPEEHRLKVGISGGLVRLSVGLENIRDLVADIGQALETV